MKYLEYKENIDCCLLKYYEQKKKKERTAYFHRHTLKQIDIRQRLAFFVVRCRALKFDSDEQ